MKNLHNKSYKIYFCGDICNREIKSFEDKLIYKHRYAKSIFKYRQCFIHVYGESMQ